MKPGQDIDNATGRAKVTILGEQYNLRGEGSADYLIRLARRVDVKMREIIDANPNLPVHKAAILTAIHLADEVEKLTKEKQDIEELMSELD